LVRLLVDRKFKREAGMADGAVREVDVIVVGGGGSGLAAASSAARLGRKVVLLEKAATLGGTTAWSVGSISATGTSHQRRAGIQDSPDEHFEDLGLFAGPLANRDNLALRRILVDNIADTFEWLQSTGLVFSGPSSEPPHRYARMHNVMPSSRAFPHHLGRHARALGVEFRLGTRVANLVSVNGRVEGVVTRDQNGREGRIFARSGVVLASGDYSANVDMKRELAGEAAARSVPVNVNSTGDGQRLGSDLGARIVNGDIVWGPRLRFVPPPNGSLAERLPPYRFIARAGLLALEHGPAWVTRPFLMSFVTTALGVDPGLYEQGAILVNAEGERFADELADPAERVVEQPGGMAYVLLDSAVADRFNEWPHFVSTAPGVAYAYMSDYRRSRRDIFHEASSIAELAKALRLPQDRLEKTVAEANARSTAERPGLRRPPYIALGPIKAYVVLTDGGLAVTDRLEVMGTDNRPIPGLFAAGSAGQGGLILNGHGHHLGWAFVSGRIAGRNAALNPRRS
jgi:succinate dehydrogenase/fumarate reductase flavoprotein subunit